MLDSMSTKPGWGKSADLPRPVTFANPAPSPPAHSTHPPTSQASVRSAFIRGSVVRFVQLPPGSVDVELLHDATRREARGG